MLGNKEEYFTIDGIKYGNGRQKNHGIMNNPSEKPYVGHFNTIRLNLAKALNVNENNCKIVN